MTSPTTTTNAPLLQLEDVHQTYELGGLELPVIEDLRLEIRKGEAVALLGPAGSGKHAILNLLTGLEEPSAGRVRLNGTDLKSIPPAVLRRLQSRFFGILMRVFALDPRRNAVEILRATLGGDSLPEDSPAPEQWLHRVGLDPDDTTVASCLSSEDRLRLAFARACVRNPAVVLCDLCREAPEAEVLVDCIETLRTSGGPTFVVSTDRADLAARFDRVVRLSA